MKSTVLVNAVQAGNRSGTGRYILELLRAFQGAALPMEVMVADILGHIGPLPAAPCQARSTAGRKLLLEHWRLPRRADSFDLVHYPAGMAPLYPCRNLVLTVHDLVALKHPEWFRRSRAAYYCLALRRGARMARRIIADSEATRQDLQELLRVPEDRIDVVPLGVSSHFYPRAAEEQAALRAQLALSAPYFLFVGTLEPRKNLGRLIAAWEAIADVVPEHLVIAGRTGWRCDDVLEACRESRCARRIHLPGHIREEALPALLSSATAFVWPSLYEGFGLPPLEAMACGAAVIASNTSSMPEVIGDAGLLLDPRDEAAWSAALLQVSQQAELRDRLRAQGLCRAAQFRWEETARLTAASYGNALK